MHEPQVLFLAEPTTGLDPTGRLTIWEELRRINVLGTTVFLAAQATSSVIGSRSSTATHRREGTPAELKADRASAAAGIRNPPRR